MSIEWSLDEIRPSVVPIRHRSKSGTGFFIGPRTLLTARHLLDDVFIGMKFPVSQGDREFTVMVSDLPEELDVAVLTTAEPSKCWLELDLQPNIGDDLVSFGFPKKYPDGDTFTAVVEGPTLVDNAPLLKFREGQVTQGFSGAPLYNRGHRGVSGVVKSTRGENQELGGRAVALASLLAAVPSLRRLLYQPGSQPRPQAEPSEPTSNDKIDLLAQEVLAGDAVVVVGDVLDPAHRVSRRAMDDFLRQETVRSLDPESRRLELLRFLRSSPLSKIKAYETLAGLPFDTVLSLHPDARLEGALHSYRSITLDDRLRVSDLAVGRKELYLFGGSVLFGTGLILNQNDRDDLRERYERLHWGLRDRLAMAPILFFGCSPKNRITKRLLFDILRHRTPLDGRLFVVGESADWSTVPGHAIFLDSHPAEVLGALHRAIDGRSPIQTQEWVIDQAPDNTRFRYLDHYTESDRSVFFARVDDCEALLEVVLSAPDKTSVLCGRSGTGKTSLVLAGLQPLLFRRTHMPVEYLRSTADPLQTLEQSLTTIFGLDSGYVFAHDHSLTRLRAHCAGLRTPILFVVDQIEEAFVKGGKEITRKFLSVIRELTATDWFPGRFLLVVREDFLHELAGDRAGGVSALASVYRLHDFDHRSAALVVTETTAAMGWDCEEGFVGAMLEDLAPDQILPAYLQIVCHRMQEASTNLGRFNVSTYTSLGRASTILRNHVNDAFEGRPREQIRLIKSILAVMITGQDTKSLLTAPEIATRSGVSAHLAEATLFALIHDFRLVREVQLDDVRFELAHESLVATITEWLDESDHRLRMIQDIIDQEMVLAKRNPGHIIPDDRLSLIESALGDLDVGDGPLGLIASSFCVRGALPAAIADRLTGLTPPQRLHALLIRPVASDEHQLEAILRSPLGDLLPVCDPADLPGILA